jgi:hypothetical protein
MISLEARGGVGPGIAVVVFDNTLEDNILYAIGGMNENARIFNKLLNTAIDGMIRKWAGIDTCP